MLWIDTPVGKISAPPHIEKQIASMTDDEFCVELNRRPCDPFVFGAWLGGARRDRISYDGWNTFEIKR